ncbi:GNAT family N-acetyltransferase [Liquorilactobacillus cacaonum]|uniref:GNAT family N-acetyltransferase n=1 Tax=Liquorilactobacillus cacaonum TaxID=483012 RepID=UPI00070CB29C|nr:GNAT family N-acetyltransferase [Liquorilactobacillus cacaonum]
MSLIYIRLATQQDILQMMAIVKDAQHLLASQDIPQWQNGYPNEKVLLNDIEKKISYVLIVNQTIAGIATLLQEPDPNYQQVVEGNWTNSKDPHYATIHRLAISSKFHGQHLAETFINHLVSVSNLLGFKQLRIDTHDKNSRMKYLINKIGFKYSAIVYMHNNPNDFRNSYQLFLD